VTLDWFAPTLWQLKFEMTNSSFIFSFEFLPYSNFFLLKKNFKIFFWRFSKVSYSSLACVSDHKWRGKDMTHLTSLHLMQANWQWGLLQLCVNFISIYILFVYVMLTKWVFFPHLVDFIYTIVSKFLHGSNAICT